MPIDKEKQTISGTTHAVNIAGQKGYIVVNEDDEGRPYEVFIKGFGKFGSAIHGWADSFAIMLSIGLHSGTTLEQFAPILCQMKFEPNGETNNPDIPECFSIPDYVAQWLVERYGSEELNVQIENIRGKKVSV